MGPQERRSTNNFDAMRFGLAAAVILSHSFDLLGRPNPFAVFARGQVGLGQVAVDSFFIISGFLITQSYLHSRSTVDYLWKRVLRIHPAFIVAGVVSLAFFGWLPTGFSPRYWDQVDPVGFSLRLLTLQTLWVPHTFTTNYWPYVNSAVWTIQYEFVCYLLVVVLGAIGLFERRARLSAVVAALFAASLVHQFSLGALLARFPTNPLFTYEEMWVGGTPAWYPHFFAYFGTGMLCHAWKDSIRYSNAGAAVALTVLLAALAVVPAYAIVMPAAGAYLIFWFAFNRAIPLQHFGRRGDFSYGVYVYGWPVQQTVIWAFAGRLPPIALFALATAGATLLAVGSWRLIEEPCLRLKRRLPSADSPRHERAVNLVAQRGD